MMLMAIQIAMIEVIRTTAKKRRSKLGGGTVWAENIPWLSIRPPADGEGAPEVSLGNDSILRTFFDLLNSFDGSE